MSRKFTSYEDAVTVFNDRGLCLDTSSQYFESMNLRDEKLKCHCIKHPDIPLEYFSRLLNLVVLDVKHAETKEALKEMI